MIKRKICILFALAALSIFSGCRLSPDTQALTAPAATGNFQVTVMQAGKADAIVLTTQNHNIIIDCGEKDDGDDIVKYLNENNIDHIDYLFITHFDKDHVGGFPEVIKNIYVENIIIPDYEGTNKEYEKYSAAVSENNLNVTALTNDWSFIIDDCLFAVNPPQKTSYDGDNDFSLVISVTHGSNKFLFAGDAEETRTAEILSKFKGEYDFLKVPHHGRYNSATKQFLKSFNPKFAVITDSEKNPADDQVLVCLNNIGCETYQTKDGSVCMTSDGKKITIEQ